MALKKYSSRYSRKNYYNKKDDGIKMSPYEVAHHAMNMARATRRLLNVEFKTVYTTYTGTAMGTGATIACLSLTASGTGDTQRVGNSILAKRLNWRFYIRRQSSTDAVIRMIIFKDVACNGALPSEADLVLATSTVTSPLNTDNGKRFKVLRDFYLNICNGSLSQLTEKGGIDLNHHIEYSGSTAAIGSCTNNHVFIMFLSNENTNPPLLNAYFTIRYIDN